jgi:hypothetical protein
LPLYYTGLTNSATISEKDEKPSRIKLKRNYEASFTLTIDANSYTWVVIGE